MQTKSNVPPLQAGECGPSPQVHVRGREERAGHRERDSSATYIAGDQEVRVRPPSSSSVGLLLLLLSRRRRRRPTDRSSTLLTLGFVIVTKPVAIFRFCWLSKAKQSQTNPTSRDHHEPGVKVHNKHLDFESGVAKLQAHVLTASERGERGGEKSVS